MKLDDFNALRVRKNINQLVIGEEIEARELASLLSHVLLQPVVAPIKRIIVSSELWDTLLILLTLEEALGEWHLLELGQELTELLVDVTEGTMLIG